MPIVAKRRLIPEQVRNFGRFGDAIEVPPLTDVQTRSYERFLQLDLPLEKRAVVFVGRASSRRVLVGQ